MFMATAELHFSQGQTGDQMDAETYLLTGKPAVLHNAMAMWPSSSWTPEFLSDQLSQPLSCKMTPLSVGRALMETECIQENVSLSNFVQWLRGQVTKDNPLLKYDRKSFSCYLDYKYMQEIFTTKPELLKAVCWESVGLDGRDGTESTLWLGSEGAYTNCHYDAYGYNLVAQIYGRKRWVLFPPSDTQYLYPTRIPFEESSIFSQVDVKHPDLKLHPKVKLTSVHEVILEPGEILYVPRHWWHYVECLEPAISINTWVELAADTESRFEEAITRSLFSSLWCSYIDMKKQTTDDNQQGRPVDTIREGGNTPEWINPKEEIWDNARNTFVLSETLNAVGEDKSCVDGCPKSDRGCGLMASNTTDCTTCNRERNLEKFARHFRGKTIKFPHKDVVEGSVMKSKNNISRPVQRKYSDISPHLNLPKKDNEKCKMSIAQNLDKEDKLSENTNIHPTLKMTTTKSIDNHLKRKQSVDVNSHQLCTAKVSKLTPESSAESLICSPDTEFDRSNVALTPCDPPIKTCLQYDDQKSNELACPSPTVASSQSEIFLTAVTSQPFVTWLSTCRDQIFDKDISSNNHHGGMSSLTPENQGGSRTLDFRIANSSLDDVLSSDNEMSYYQQETRQPSVYNNPTGDTTDKSNTSETANSKNMLTFEKFVKCVTHPKVIRTIAEVIKNVASD